MACRLGAPQSLLLCLLYDWPRRPPEPQRRLILPHGLFPESYWSLLRRNGAGWRQAAVLEVPACWVRLHLEQAGSFPVEAHGAHFWGSQSHGAHFRGSQSGCRGESPGGAFKSFSSCEALLIFSLRLVTGDGIYNEHSYPHINDQLNSCPSFYLYSAQFSLHCSESGKESCFFFPFFFFFQNTSPRLSPLGI